MVQAQQRRNWERSALSFCTPHSEIGICNPCIDAVIELNPDIDLYDIALLLLKWHQTK